MNETDTVKKERQYIVITQYSTFRSAVCEVCRWTTTDKKRLMKNVLNHQERHSPRPPYVERLFQPEVLVVSQGFEGGDLGQISDFKMDDFRNEKLPHYSEKNSPKFKSFYKIEKYMPGSDCPWGYSRWVNGKDGKLYMLDQRWDSS